jgi:hypothetical protein
MLLCSFTLPIFSQEQYDMSYKTFTEYIKQEMSTDEFKSVNDHFGGDLNGIICTYEYGDFSGDSLDDFVVFTSEDKFEYGQKIDVYVFRGMENGTFNYVDKVSFPYWKTRYEVAPLIKRGVLFVTSTDQSYENWVWNAYEINEENLELVNRITY